MHGTITTRCEILPPELQKQVSDFVVFLRKNNKSNLSKKNRR
jgi:hypothetical protein